MKKLVLAVLGAMLVLASPAAAADPALSWTAPQTIAPDAVTDIDCPTIGFCVAVDVEGNVITTTDPAGPAAGWTAADVHDAWLSSVSCSSPSLCVAGSREGNLLTSTNPAGGAAAWTASKVPGVDHLEAVDCTAGGCAAVDADGKILVSSNPTGGPGSWIVAEIVGATLTLSALDCPNSSLCVIVGHAPRSLGGGVTVQENLVVTITNPFGSGRSFKNSFIGFRTFLRAVSCPTPTFCLAVDADGYAWSSDDPSGGEAAWREAFIDPSENLTDVSCPTSSFCVAVDEAGRVLTSTNPAGEASDWGVTTTHSGFPSLSCPSASLCLAAAEREVTVGTPFATGGNGGERPPAPTSPAWRPTPIPAGKLAFGRTSRLAIKGGRVKVPLSCTGASSCHGILSFRAGKLKIGTSAGFRISLGTTKMVPVRLNKKGRQLFEDKAKVRVQAVLDSRGTSKAADLRKSLLLQWKR